MFRPYTQIRFAARNPKFETNSNDEKQEKFKSTSFGVLDLSFAICWFVSDFDIRISDFVAFAPSPLREKFLSCSSW